MRLPRPGSAALLLIPGGLVVALGFSAGGFFAGPPALAATVLALVVVARLTLADDPLAGVGPAYLLGGLLIVLFAGWTLASSWRSDSVARALVEYDRALLYVLVFALCGAVGRSDDRVRWLVRGTLLGLFVVCLAGFITRALPDVWPTSASIANDRLSHPLTYWNALGIMAAVGAVLAFATSADRREHAIGRVLAAAALPVFGVALLFTFSRGAMAAGVAGLVLAVVLGRSLSLLSAVIAAVPAAFAVKVAYGADLLASDRPTAPAAVEQGHEVAVAVALAVAVAAALRVLMLLFDRRIERLELPAPLRHPALAAAAAVLVLGVAGAGAVALGAPDAVQRQYERFVEGDAVQDAGDRRTRLTNPGNNGRLDQWRVALRESRSERTLGTGAGTYALLWERGRAQSYQVEDAHSLYVEVLAELGIVGLGLLLAAILLMLGAFVWRARGPDRGVYAALGGAGLAWCLHAGIDWDWEMPATGIWLFAAGGLVLSRASVPAGSRPHMPRLARVVAALAVLLVAVMPSRMYLSERALTDATRAFARGDCEEAVDRSLDSIAIVSHRPEPFEVLGFCDVRLGYPRLAIAALDNAVRRDPANWEFHYGLALVRGAAGQDPREAAARSLELNPRSELAADIVERFDTQNPRAWKRRALAARLPRD